MSNNSPTENNTALNFIKVTSKDILIGLITTLLSGFAITYFITREFITHYIDLIGFDALEQYVITNESTVHSLTWSISTLVFSIIYILCFAPMLLRFFYSNNRHHVENFQRVNPFLSILVITIIFSAFPLVALLLAYNEWDINLAFIAPILLAIPIYLILYFENGREQLTIGQIFSYLSSSIIFTFSCTLALFPFYFLLTKIDYASFLGTSISDGTMLFSLVILWLVYILFYGIRIIYNSIHQYIIDISIAVFSLLLILAFSPITIILPVVEKSGIKDTSPQIYKINESDYETYLEKHIENYWISSSNNIVNNCIGSKEKLECTFLRTEKESKTELNSIYLNLLTIYRDDDRHIVCPPNYRIQDILRKGESAENRDKLVAKCFSVPTSILQPTSLSVLTLKENKEYIIDNSES